MYLIIPIFINHQGCPHLCLFCNQNAINGVCGQYDEPPIRAIIEEWLERSRGDRQVQVAFYGGSFTCLPLGRQQAMLQEVRPFLDSGRVHGIRLSTRPDCITPEICLNLKRHGVLLVELGVQSFDDDVLCKAKRGHTAKDTRRAIALLQEKGIDVGIQLMAGLPGEDSRSFLMSVKETVKMRPSLVRIYPVLVVAHSELSQLYAEGRYRPLSLNKAIALSCKAKEIFDKSGIKVIRMGLQASQSLERDLVAGPYHPAFGELVTSRTWFTRVRRLLTSHAGKKNVEIHISKRDLSAFVGLKKRNLKRLEQLGLLHIMTLVTRNDLERGTLNDVVCK